MPAVDVPEKLTVGAPVYNQPLQGFSIPLTTDFKSVADGRGDSYTVQGRITVTASDGSTHALDSGPQPAVPADGRAGGTRLDVALRPLSIPWDRNGGAIVGLVRITGTVVLVRDQGGPPTDSADISGSVDVR